MPDQETGSILCGREEIRYSIERSKRRRRTIGLLLGKEGEIRVLAPARAKLPAIENLLRREQAWIRRKVEERLKNAPIDLLQGTPPRILFQGSHHVVQVEALISRPETCVIEDNCLKVNLHELAAEPSQRREDLRLALLLFYKKQARHIFPQRLEVWQQKLQLCPHTFAVSNPQRLWGSCSGRNDIRINWRLVMAPLDLLDYVIVHELCHIREKNHSAHFWRLVETVMPDWQTKRAKLRSMTALLTF